MKQEYYDTNQIRAILGCSGATAREIMRQLPLFRVAQNRRSPYRVKIDDFNRYIEEHTIQPDQPPPLRTL